MTATFKIIVIIKVSVIGVKRLLKGLSRQVSEFIRKFTRTRLNRWALLLHLKTMQKADGCATNHQSLL